MDIYSSPTLRTSNLQLAVEHPLAGKHWNPPKEDITYSKAKKKL